MPADPTMRTHCDDCDRRDLCDIIKRGTAPCRQNAGMGLAAADLLADFRAEVDRLRAERDSADPTPAAPDAQPRVCSNCGAMLGPKETGHFVPPSVGESGFYYCRGAAPDQAEGPDENRGDDVPSVTSRVEESVMDKGVFRYDTDKTRLGAPLVPWDPSHREIL